MKGAAIVRHLDPLQSNSLYKGFHLGDANGEPVDGPSYGIHCHDYWINDEIGNRRKNGPCHFRFTTGNILHIKGAFTNYVCIFLVFDHVCTPLSLQFLIFTPHLKTPQPVLP